MWLKMVVGVRESRSLAPYPADAWRRFDVDATKLCNIDVDTTSVRRSVHPGLAWIHVGKAKTARRYKKKKRKKKKTENFTEKNISVVLPARDKLGTPI